MRTWIIGINRLLLAVLAAVPFLFLKPFYLHFHVYLTGTVINGIVTDAWHLVLISIVVFGLFLIPLTYRKRAKWVDYGLVVMLIGMALIVAGWVSLYTQVRQPGFAGKGIYQYSRHPQYLGFVLLVIGWFFGWPTILTLIFSPILVYKYIKAARSEEADMLRLHGETYAAYRKSTPFLV